MPAPDPRYVEAALKKAGAAIDQGERLPRGRGEYVVGTDVPTPSVIVTAAAIELRYAPEALGPRCSADDAAVRALKGVSVGEASQCDVVDEARRLVAHVVRYAIRP